VYTGRRQPAQNLHSSDYVLKGPLLIIIIVHIYSFKRNIIKYQLMMTGVCCVPKCDLGELLRAPFLVPDVWRIGLGVGSVLGPLGRGGGWYEVQKSGDTSRNLSARCWS
jgi:hypothetical protein